MLKLDAIGCENDDCLICQVADVTQFERFQKFAAVGNVHNPVITHIATPCQVKCVEKYAFGDVFQCPVADIGATEIEHL